MNANECALKREWVKFIGYNTVIIVNLEYTTLVNDT